jgi:4-hydroxy-tetrahydrodipicolinate synthase
VVGVSGAALSHFLSASPSAMLNGMARTWEGIFCALWTPVNEKGELLEGALRDHLAFLKSKGMAGVLVLGSTGEFPLLDIACRKRAVELVVESAGPLEVIVNVSDIQAASVADLAHFARQMEAAAVSVLPPWFYPVRQEDLLEFFIRVGEWARLPLFLYNFPERTGNRIALETVSAVANRVHLAGIKQSGNEFAYHADLVQLGRERGFVVLTGADTRLPEALALGVTGCVSGLANAVPEWVTRAYDSVRRAQADSATELLAEIARRIQSLAFPLDVAAVMRARGWETGAPKSVISAATRTRFEQIVTELKEWVPFGQLKG